MCIAQRPRRTGSRLRRQTVALPFGRGLQGGGPWGMGLSSSPSCPLGQTTYRGPRRTSSTEAEHPLTAGGSLRRSSPVPGGHCVLPTHISGDRATGIAASWTQCCPQPRQPAREKRNLSYNLYSGCSSPAHPVHPVLKASSSSHCLRSCRNFAEPEDSQLQPLSCCILRAHKGVCAL